MWAGKPVSHSTGVPLTSCMNTTNARSRSLQQVMAGNPMCLHTVDTKLCTDIPNCTDVATSAVIQVPWHLGGQHMQPSLCARAHIHTNRKCTCMRTNACQCEYTHARARAHLRIWCIVYLKACGRARAIVHIMHHSFGLCNGYV